MNNRMGTEILLLRNLQYDGDFDTQVKKVLGYIRMSKEEVESLQLLFNDLQEIFGNTWKGSQLEVFGSIVTGLALRSSDVDVLVSLPSWLDMPRAIFVIEARKILQRNPKFWNVFSVPKAKVPIVHFTYVPTNTQCDVSFSTRAALKNSKLLQYLIFSDERILPLTVLIKYWSKVHSFTGKNLMSSYSLTLLFIFYLQQKHIIPPIKSLQQNVAEDIEDNWDTAFSRSIGKSCNNDRSYTLLGEFFNYYKEINFQKYIISLYTGTLIEREKFARLESNILRDFELYKTNVTRSICQPLRTDTMMCIQDPFNHSRNCSVVVYPRLAMRIKDIFNNAANIYETEAESKFLPKLLYTNETQQSKVSSVFRHLSAKSRGVRKNYRSQANLHQNRKKISNYLNSI